LGLWEPMEPRVDSPGVGLRLRVYGLRFTLDHFPQLLGRLGSKFTDLGQG